MYSLLLGNNRQHTPVSAKTISSWTWKVLGIAKAHMSPSALQRGCSVCTLASGVSLVSIPKNTSLCVWRHTEMCKHLTLDY